MIKRSTSGFGCTLVSVVPAYIKPTGIIIPNMMKISIYVKHFETLAKEEMSETNLYTGMGQYPLDFFGGNIHGNQ